LPLENEPLDRSHNATVTFRIAELCCSEEMALVEKGLHRLSGVTATCPDYVNRTLQVDFRPTETDAAAIARTIEAAGFDVERAAVGPAESGVAVRWRWRRTTTLGGLLLLTSAVAAVVAGRIPPPIQLLAVLSAAVSGIPVARAAWRAVRLGSFDMNVLMSVAAIGAVTIGETFEAATAMFLFALSLWLESHGLDRARRAVRSLVRLTPRVAHRLDRGGVTDVDPSELRVGDRVLVRPGQRVPIDGRVVEGRSSVNQAPITGESLPVEKHSGDDVFAGSLNAEGSLTIEATRTAEATTLAHIVRLVAQAESRKSPTERFIDRFARRYTPVVIVLAVFLALGPPMLGYLGVAWAGQTPAVEWLRRGLVLLVIACPCALVISTPVTIVSGLFSATRRGILIKGGVHLESAGRIDAVALDKTGTLTTGEPRVVSIEPFADRREDEILEAAASLERHSEHPLARAIVAEARRRGLPEIEVGDFAALRGFGVRGTFQGQTLYVGAPRLFLDSRMPIGASARAEAVEVQQRDSATAALVGTSTSIWGVLRLADPPRPEAARALARLRELGVHRIAMLTGDGRGVAEAVARAVGIDEVHADLLPEDKVARVRQISAATSCLAMVGDGVNDAPALAASRLGIALGSGASDTALETADVVVMVPDLGRLGELVDLGCRCRKILWENITLSLTIKTGVLALAAAGWATLWMAVAADVGASLVVIFNGMRLARPSRRQ
jgi:Zn2+/Cd2+-exporting ATPase